MTTEHSGIVPAVSWCHDPATGTYAVGVAISSGDLDRLATDASDECVELAIQSEGLTVHTGRTGHEYLVLETDDAIEYRATVLDPDEAKGLMTIELSGRVADN